MAKKKFKTKKIEPRNTNEGKHKTYFYYSFLTIVLLLCLAQISFSAIMNISKIIVYKQKIATIAKTEEDAENRNLELKRDIQNFSSVQTLESIARNNLKMASKDEVMILVNSKREAPKKKKTILGSKKEKAN